MVAAVEMSGAVQSAKRTSEKDLETSLGVLRDKSREFARLSVTKKISLLKESMLALSQVAPDWVRSGCRAKGIAEEGPPSGEEWLAGPMTTMRNLRLLVRSLEGVQRSGRPELDAKQLKRRSDGRVEVRVFPTDGIDGALFAGFTVHQLMMPGLGLDEVRARQAQFYSKRDPDGGVSLILGAGNVSSIPPMDFLYKSFADGNVCMIKMNPVNEWVGPHLERAFKSFVDAGYLRISYGGGDVGAHLVQHPAIADIHITGSNHTHDMIVWGPPGPERERRKAAKDPVLEKTITSELGNVSPIAVIPGDYSEAELDFLARNLVSMVTNNASFNCNAGKMVITASGWAQKSALFDRMQKLFETIPTRSAYYPGAQDRYRRLTEGRDARKFGNATAGQLPWTMVLNVDSAKADDPLFEVEPFCSIISETSIDAKDPEEFIKKATVFMNDRMWGTLNAMLVVPPQLEGSAVISAAVDRAVLDLRYGTVAINHWPAVVYGTVSPAWGGHPSATLENVQSGLGWVHNTYLLDGIEKSVLRGPFTVFPKPVWFFDNKKPDQIGRKMVELERSPSWLKVPGVALTALGG